ncbi:hypothetical protein L7F22_054218 [Adiantum nelumboides]|nr:hypothetical protein [Adiantum nelumboides]
MNGAEPIQSGVNDKDAAGRKDANGEPITAHGIKYVPVWLDNAVAHGHYEGYCKTHLWPLFHYLLWQDVPGDRRVWDDYSWEAYVAANEAYAQRVAEQYRPGDLCGCTTTTCSLCRRCSASSCLTPTSASSSTHHFPRARFSAVCPARRDHRGYARR